MWTRFVSSVKCLRTSSVSGSGARVEALRKMTYCVHARKERDRGEESERESERERERAAWYNLSLNKPPGSSNHSSALQSALSYGTVPCRLQLRLCPLKKRLRGICLKRGGTCQGNEAVAQTWVKMKALTSCPTKLVVSVSSTGSEVVLSAREKREREMCYVRIRRQLKSFLLLGGSTVSTFCQESQDSTSHDVLWISLWPFLVVWSCVQICPGQRL